MSKERIEINIRVDKETGEWFTGLQKKSKKYLANELLCIALEVKLKIDEAKMLKNENEKLQTKLDKCETHCEQGRAMIEAIMERWYEYDV